MSKFVKLLQRFISKPKDFTCGELVALLHGFGYFEIKLGMTSGSRVAFLDIGTKHMIRLHKPHPSPVLKRYQLDDVEDELRSKGIIK